MKNKVLDIGGNKTSDNVLQGLNSTHMYRMIDLFIIPMSGGSQDLKMLKKLSFLYRSKILLFGYILLAIPVIAVCVAVIIVLKDVPKATVIGSNNFPQSSKIFAKNGFCPDNG